MDSQRLWNGVFVCLLLTAGAASARGTASAWHEQPQPASDPTEVQPSAEQPKGPASSPEAKPPPAGEEPAVLPAPPLAGPEPALSGYCPAAYLLSGKAMKGDPAYKSTYAGEVYYLSNEDAKRQFDADPERFLPQFNGLCTTGIGGSYGNRHPSNPEIFDIVDGKVYLFSSQRAKRAYDRGPQVYITNGSVRFNQPGLDGYSPVSYQARNRALRGREQFKYRYRNYFYWFANADEMARFISSPEKYLPQYDGFCADGILRGKRFVANPECFAVFNGKTYLFFDTKALAEFQVDLPEKLKKADENWPVMKQEEDARIRSILFSQDKPGD